MVKKVLMLPLMALVLVTLTAATVSEDGEDIFTWEVEEQSTSLPSETATEEYLWGSTAYDFETHIYDNDDSLDIFISSDDSGTAYMYYNFDNVYDDYETQNRIDLETDWNEDTNDYIHIKITDYSGHELSFIGGMNSETTTGNYAPDFNELETFAYTKYLHEEIGGALATIVTAGSSVFVAAFDGLWDVFWDADANDGEGALNWIAYVAVLPVGFFLVRWGFRKILGMIQQRL